MARSLYSCGDNRSEGQGRRASRPAGLVPRFGGSLQPGEGVLHPFGELAGPIGGDVDDAGPGRDPRDLVGLGDPGAAVGRLEAVTPGCPLAATFLGDEAELAAGFRHEHATPTRPLYEATRSAPVVTHERGTDGGALRPVLPLDTLALGAQLAHTRQVCHQGVEMLRPRADDRLGAVLGQPPPAALLARACHVSPSSTRDPQANGISYCCQDTLLLYFNVVTETQTHSSAPAAQEPPRTDRRARRRQETIEEILEIAREIMTEEGVNGLSLAEVARRLGVQPPSLYKYFPSLMAVYDAIFLRGQLDNLAELRQGMAGAEPGLPALIAGLEASGRWCLANRAVAELLFWRPVPSFHPSSEAFAVSLEMVELQRRALAAAVAKGQLGPAANEEGAIYLVSVLIVGVLSQTFANEPDLPWGEGRFTPMFATLMRLLPAAFPVRE